MRIYIIKCITIAHSMMIHVYTGDGKGKTTAAVGLCCRAAGVGKRVLFAQFLKGRPTGEVAALESLGVAVWRTGVQKFVPFMTEEERADCKLQQISLFELAQGVMGQYDVVVLDEIIGAVTLGLIPLESVIELIKRQPEQTELILTGRDAPEELTRLADYVSDIRAVKHPYDAGVPAREGIEY